MEKINGGEDKPSAVALFGSILDLRISTFFVKGDGKLIESLCERLLSQSSPVKPEFDRHKGAWVIDMTQARIDEKDPGRWSKTIATIMSDEFSALEVSTDEERRPRSGTSPEQSEQSITE